MSAPVNGRSVSQRPARPFDPSLTVSLVVVVALTLWAALGLDARWARLTDVPSGLWRVIRLMVTNLSWDDLGECLQALWDSIAIAWLGTLVAAVFAIPLGFVAAENLMPRWVVFVVRQVLNVLRAVPEIILVLVLLPVFGFSKTAGILAIGIGSIGTLGKLCADVIEGIDRGPIEAADAVGATQLQRLRWAVVPQSVPEMASFVLYRFEINIRVSTILGAVGAGGIGQVVNDALRIALPPDYGLAGMALIVVIVGTIAVDTLSGAVRRRIVAGPQGRPDEVSAGREAEMLTDSLVGQVTALPFR